MTVPFIGRLSFQDYQRIAFTFLILAIETLLRFLFYLVPVSVLDWIRFHVITNVYPRIFKGFHDEEIKEERNPFVGAKHTTDLIHAHGYDVEEHNIFTADGYLLVLHRVIHSSKSRKQNGTQTTTKKPVLLMHGCMMSSEVWVCLRAAQKCLPFVLLEAGYDVWLGNIRGNKYCQKHATLKPSSVEFWDFSLDEIVMYDLPAMIDYILSVSPGHKKLTYVGFSQGSTIGFAALSLKRELNDKVGFMVALAATTKPKGMQNRLVQALTKASPELIYLFFSRKIFLKMVIFWKEIIFAKAFARIIEICQSTLFGWENAHIRVLDKIIAYQHLYAFTSSKLIVHWFQIMRARRLQMYDEGSPVQIGSGHVVPRYTLESIQTKIALFLGGKDTLVDNEYTKTHLGESVIHVTEIEEYEHLDFLWAADLDSRVHPAILELIKANTK